MRSISASLWLAPLLAFAPSFLTVSASTAQAAGFAQDHNGRGVCRYGKCFCGVGYASDVNLKPGENAADFTVVTMLTVSGEAGPRLVSSTQGFAARNRFRTELVPRSQPSLTFKMDYEGQTLTGDLAPFEVVPGAETKGSAGGATIRLTVLNHLGGVGIEVGSDSGDWLPDKLTSFELTESGSTLTVSGGNVVFSGDANFSRTSFPACGQVEGEKALVRRGLFDKHGKLVDGRLDGEELTAAKDAPEIAALLASTNDDGDMRVVLYTRDSLGDAGGVSVSVRDEGSEDVLFQNQAGELEGVERQFVDRTLTFEDPAAAVGQVYTVTVDALGEDGSSLGVGESQVVVSTKPEDVVPFEMVIGGQGVIGQVSVVPLDGSNFRLAVALLSDAPAAVSVTFAPGSGTPSMPEEITMPLSGSFARWVVNAPFGTGMLPPGTVAGIRTTVTDDTGRVRDFGGGVVTEVPSSMYLFGSGTSKAATSTSTKPELL